MRRTITIVAALVMSLNFVFAQNQSSDLLSDIENLPSRRSKEVPADGDFKKADVEAVGALNLGFHSLKSDAFTTSGLRSGQIDFALFNAYLRPVSWFSLNVGADIAWDYYRSKDRRFDLDNANNIVARDMTADETKSKDRVSRITTTSFLFPATLRIYAGKWEFLAGAEAILNLNASVHTSLLDGNTRTITHTKGANVNRWGYDFIGALSYDGLGVFVKYMPETVRQFPEPGPSLERWTFGLRLGF